MNTDIKAAVALLRNVHSAVALTGAGISTPSGIPDFRSAGAGLWRRFDPSVATLSAFRRRPEQFFEWVRPLTAQILAAVPNAAHMALTHLEQEGPLRVVITQNIDNLHLAAGSAQVFELHGHLREATCQSCASVVPAEDMLRTFAAGGPMPACRRCHGVLKPNVVLFGEMLPARIYRRALEAVVNCDLLLVAGSSLEVAPVSDFPHLARANGAALIVINREPTPVDHLADVVLRGDVAEVLPQLAEGVRSGPRAGPAPR